MTILMLDFKGITAEFFTYSHYLTIVNYPLKKQRFGKYATCIDNYSDARKKKPSEVSFKGFLSRHSGE